VGILSKETRLLQNPALGAVILWKFVLTYYEAHNTHEPPPFHLLFLILPMVLQESTRSVILSTRKSSSLRAFAEKFSSSQMSKADVVLSLQKRINDLKTLTMDSLEIMVGSGMATIEAESGRVIPSKARGLKQETPDGIDLLLRAAEYLGIWMSGISVYETVVTLRTFL
jgi:Family of unknown function (DUF6521)